MSDITDIKIDVDAYLWKLVLSECSIFVYLFYKFSGKCSALNFLRCSGSLRIVVILSDAKFSALKIPSVSSRRKLVCKQIKKKLVSSRFSSKH